MYFCGEASEKDEFYITAHYRLLQGPSSHALKLSAIWGHLKKGKFTYAKDCRGWFREAGAGGSRPWPLAYLARQADMLPAEGRDVLEQGSIDRSGFPKQSDGAFQVDRVPQRDRGDHQVETAGAILLILEGTVADLAEPVEEHSPGEGVSGFALV